MINKNVSEYICDDKILISRIHDMITLSQNKCIPKFTFFLNSREQAIALNTIKGFNYSNYRFYGGYDNAERKVLGIYPDFYNCENIEFPINAVEYSYRKIDLLSHRDFLGSILSHQIKRETIGDIIVEEGRGIVFTFETVTNYLLENITKIGRTGVSLKIIQPYDIQINYKFEEIQGTVASMRLDCIISLATKFSRQKCIELIKSLGVYVNQQLIFEPSYILNQDDKFSVRGYGKFILHEIGGTSKKNRIFVKIKKYI